MSVAAVILLAVAPTGWLNQPDAEVLALAEQAFVAGSNHWQDAAQARPQFALAAAGYDELWRRGYRNPQIALNRARSHRLAGDLPRTIVALHEGLATTRWNRPLQVTLEEAREAVNYPLVGDLQSQCRPATVVTIGNRMSPVEGWLAAGLLWLIACCAVARYIITRAARWLLVALLAIPMLGVLGWLWLNDEQLRRNTDVGSLIVLREDVMLRRGNAEAYPPRLDKKLPRGVEAHELGRRGGWVQIRLAGGAVGWVPEPAVLRVVVS
jgi:hypothetical protein